MESNEFVSLCSDTTFKRLFKDDEYKKWFIGFIKSITNVDLTDYYVFDNESNTGNKIKDYRMDIVLKRKDAKEIVIIEMNNYKYNLDKVLNKSYQYLYRVASSAYQKGEDYSDITVKLIAFNNFETSWLPKDTGIVNFKMMPDDRNIKYVRKEIESYEIYLPKYKKVSYNVLKDYEVPLAMIRAESYEELRSIARGELDFKIVKELERLSMEDEFMIQYDGEIVLNKLYNTIKNELIEKGMAEGFEQGIAQGIEKGLEQGIEKGIQQGIAQGTKIKETEIVKNMLDKNFTEEQISLVLGVTTDEAKKIIETI